MTVEPLAQPPTAVLGPDEPQAPAPPSPGPGNAFIDALGKAFGDASAALAGAERTERSFVSGRGGLQEMVLQRAQADVALSLASATVSRVSQALTTILGMQI